VAIAAGFATVAISSLAIVAPAMIVLGLACSMTPCRPTPPRWRPRPRPRGFDLRQCPAHGQAAGVWLSDLLIARIAYLPIIIAAGAALLVVGGTFALLIDSRPTAS
jgi:hypothetical protein